MDWSIFSECGDALMYLLLIAMCAVATWRDERRKFREYELERRRYSERRLYEIRHGNE